MTNTIYFDMDGTIANLYGVNGWLESIINRDASPYTNAEPMVRMNSLARVLNTLKRKGFKKVLLVPIMMVAGDHANNDMAGDEEDSHKSILEKEGFQVRAYLHGIGENKKIQKIFVERANDAWNALQGK